MLTQRTWEEWMDGTAELEPEKSRQDGTYQWAASSPIPHPRSIKKETDEIKKQDRLRHRMLSSSVRREKEINEIRRPKGATSVRNLGEILLPLAIKKTERCRNILLFSLFPPQIIKHLKEIFFFFFLQNKIKTFFLRNKFLIVFLSSFKKMLSVPDVSSPCSFSVVFAKNIE